MMESGSDEQQYSIAADDKIRVRLSDTTSAENDTDNGGLKWDLSLAPGASETVRVGYEVCYPKGSRVNL